MLGAKFYFIESFPIWLKLYHIYARYLIKKFQSLNKIRELLTTNSKFHPNFDTFLHHTLDMFQKKRPFSYKKVTLKITLYLKKELLKYDTVSYFELSSLVFSRALDFNTLL